MAFVCSSKIWFEIVSADCSGAEAIELLACMDHCIRAMKLADFSAANVACNCFF